MSTQCDSRDHRHNNVVTAGGNDLKQEPKTETRTSDEGIVKNKHMETKHENDFGAQAYWIAYEDH